MCGPASLSQTGTKLLEKYAEDECETEIDEHAENTDCRDDYQVIRSGDAGPAQLERDQYQNNPEQRRRVGRDDADGEERGQDVARTEYQVRAGRSGPEGLLPGDAAAPVTHRERAEGDRDQVHQPHAVRELVRRHVPVEVVREQD